MSGDNSAQGLHDKATRGESLSAEEQAVLDQWYARQDEAEGRLLGGTAAQENVAALRAGVDAALAQLATATQQVQALTAENEVIRREVAALRRQLAQRSTKQPA